MIIHGCRASTTRDRAHHLQGLLEKRVQAPALADADKALNDLWKAKASGNKPLLAVQRTWLAYRDAQCAWEESREKGTRDRCAAQLTATRTKELESDTEEP